MDELQTLAPCGHPKSEAWDGCDTCASNFIDRRGGHPLGRHHLLGVGAGLAVDLRDDGRVIVYMLNADIVAGDSGGVSNAWVTHDDRVALEPDVELAAPTHALRPDLTAQELADFCEVMSELATSMRPVVDELLNSGTTAKQVVGAFEWWLDQRGTKPQARHTFWSTFRLLTKAMAVRLGREIDEEDAS